MGTSSPRSIDFTGSARSDRSSEGNNSAREKTEEGLASSHEKVKRDNFFKSPEKSKEEPRVVRKISQ